MLEKMEDEGIKQQNMKTRQQHIHNTNYI